MTLDHLVPLIPILPFVGFIANGLVGGRLRERTVSILGCAGPGLAFVLAVVGFFAVRSGGGPLTSQLWTWITVGSLEASLGFRLDELSAVMALVVTGVGTLIHIYSVGYMKGDPGFARYFSYLNLFTAAMLILVLADNIVLLFLGWEGVGLCSYLLIGFWYRDVSNCAAGIKAFVVNRVGDLGFLLGIFLIFVTFETFNLQEINTLAAGASPGTVAAIAVLLFIGATGKSAQIPLYVWLPDAMAGPTPVSALIHAATMVTSGVYMVARLGGLYQSAPEISGIVAGVGAATALLAALIAVSQTDIKKVLAYSTVSQLGYMFLAAGVGAYGIAIFHLVTHAFFKALLFLGAGAVIHSLHHEQDMRRMGGLRERIPQTYGLFVVGALALAGFPLTAGFFSKDEILHAAHGGHWTLVWVVGLVTAVLTAFYITRQIILVFHGKYRGEDSGTTDAPGHEPLPLEKVHESPPVMRAPLYVLALLSLVGGFLAVPHFVEGAVPPLDVSEAGKVAGWILGGALSVGGIAAGVLAFTRGRAALRGFLQENSVGRLGWKLSSNKFFVDEIYERLIVRPLFLGSEILFFVIDRAIIDWALVGGSALAARGLGGALRRLQTGRIPAYAAWFVCGVIALLGIVWLAS